MKRMKKPFNIHHAKIGLPFEVPSAYFEKLPQDIQARVRKFYGLPIHEIPKETFFLVPQEYFAELPQHIQAKVSLWEGSQPGENPAQSLFILPASSLEELPRAIQARIQQLEAKDFTEKPQAAPFEAPKDFFSGLEQSILAQTSQKPSEILPAYSQEHPFEVPGPYFEQLAHAIQDRVREERSQESRWALPPALVLRWAGAFILLVGLGVGLWQLSPPPSGNAQEGNKPSQQDSTLLPGAAPESLALGEETNVPEESNPASVPESEDEPYTQGLPNQALAQAPVSESSPSLQEVPDELLLEYIDQSFDHEIELAEAYALLDFEEPSQEEFWEDVLDEDPQEELILGDLSEKDLHALAKLLQTKP